MKRALTVLCIAAAALALFGCTKEKSEIKVMSFNIRLSPNDDFDGENSWLYRKTGVISMIEDVKPDIFGIQEGLFAQVNFMDDNLPGYGRYGVGRDDGQDRGEANAIFWSRERFELLDKGTFWLSETPDTVSRGWDGACNRVVTWVKLSDKSRKGKNVWFFNTHFDHVGKVAREESGKLLMSRMTAMVPEDEPVFLTGDFNANHDDEILNPVKAFMGMARDEAPVSDTLNTYHGWNTIDLNAGGHIIDHIFFRGAEPGQYVTWTENYGLSCISDHYPVFAVFELK